MFILLLFTLFIYYFVIKPDILTTYLIPRGTGKEEKMYVLYVYMNMYTYCVCVCI